VKIEIKRFEVLSKILEVQWSSNLIIIIRAYIYHIWFYLIKTIILLMNTSNLIDLIAQTKYYSVLWRQYETHRRKVESIMTKSSHSLSFRKSDPFNSFHSSKDKANRYSMKSKHVFI
jgi:hypothetical protein